VAEGEDAVEVELASLTTAEMSWGIINGLLPALLRSMEPSALRTSGLEARKVRVYLNNTDKHPGGHFVQRKIDLQGVLDKVLVRPRGQAGHVHAASPASGSLVVGGCVAGIRSHGSDARVLGRCEKG
jgi:hypothetical protein